MSDFVPNFDEINRVIGEMNLKHFCVFVGSSYVIAYKKPIGDGSDYELIYMKEKEFYLKYKNRLIQTGLTTHKEPKPKFSSYADLWLQSPYRLNYNNVVFKPTSQVFEKEFNLWRGFNVDLDKLADADPGACPKFLEFVLEIICSGSERLFDYVLDWCADAVQNPENKQGVALVLKSEVNGTGKTFFCDCFGRLFGKHYMLASKADHILGKFTGHLEYNIILGAEEAVFVKNVKAKNELKDMITSETKNIERKRIDIELSKPNYTHIIFMGNETHIVNADMTDRRFQVIEVSAAKAKNRAYFDGIVLKAWKNGERESFLKLLQTRDIKNLNLEDSRIINKETLEQRFLSLPDFEKWLNGILNDGGVIYLREDDFGHKITEFAEFKTSSYTDIDSEIIYNDYISFCGKIKTKTIRTKQEISRMIKKIIPGFESMPRQSKYGKKMTPWRIPQLIESRKAWENYYGFKFNWTDEDTCGHMKNASSVQLETA